jgi:hypothetical protein
MKNTGKRIFFTAAVIALTNLALLVAAGTSFSQR